MNFTRSDDLLPTSRNDFLYKIATDVYSELFHDSVPIDASDKKFITNRLYLLSKAILIAANPKLDGKDAIAYEAQKLAQYIGTALTRNTSEDTVQFFKTDDDEVSIPIIPAKDHVEDVCAEYAKKATQKLAEKLTVQGIEASNASEIIQPDRYNKSLLKIAVDIYSEMFPDPSPLNPTQKNFVQDMLYVLAADIYVSSKPAFGDPSHVQNVKKELETYLADALVPRENGEKRFKISSDGRIEFAPKPNTSDIDDIIEDYGNQAVARITRKFDALGITGEDNRKKGSIQSF